MRKTFVVLVAAAILAAPALAELQNIEVGGSLRIRGNWYTGEIWTWDDDWGNTLSFVEQRTRLNVKADFTDEVSAFIELDSWDVWGEDLRTNYITGVDSRAAAADDVEVYQSYIEAKEMWGQPLSARIGRQELALGSQWLIGVNDTSSFFTGLSFDGILLTYETDTLRVHGVWVKAVERSPLEEDGDVDLYGVYGSYLGLEDITIDAYWLFVRDAISRDTWLDWWDDEDVVQLHTIGLRGAGTIGAFDFEAEVAYQFGDAERLPRNPLDRDWDWNDDADFDALGGNLEVGYTFDMNWTPRVYLGGAYLGGSDDEELSFNRLFSNWEYSEFIAPTRLSNVWIARAGVSAMPTEQVELLLAASYFEADEAIDCWLFDVDEELGWELGLYMTYNYSEDLSLECGWAHMFVDDGLEDSNYVSNNGLRRRIGTDDDDADYLYFETKISF